MAQKQGKTRWKAALNLATAGAWITVGNPVGLRAAELNGSSVSIPAATNVAQVRRIAARRESIGCPVALEGSVLWVSPAKDEVILQDDTGGEDIRMRDLPPLETGQRARLEGTGLAGLGRLREVLVDNDGLHAVTERSGSVYLKAGLHPIRVEWFNGLSSFALEVEFQGPGSQRQRIPDSALYRMEADQARGGSNLVHGVNYRCYEGNWARLPDFSRLKAVKMGAAANF